MHHRSRPHLHRIAPLLLALAACTGEVGYFEALQDPAPAPGTAQAGAGTGPDAADVDARDDSKDPAPAQGGDPNTKGPAPDPDPTPDAGMPGPQAPIASDGAVLYAQHCASCHGDRGQGTPLGLPLNRDMGLVALVMKIDAQMPLGNPDACTGECAEQVAAYVQAEFVDKQDGRDPPVCQGTQVGARQLRLLTRREYQNTVEQLLGIEAPNLSGLPVEPRVSGFDNNARAAVVTSRHADGYASLAERLARGALQAHPDLLGCGADDCLERAVRDFGKRVFRRPLTDDELQRYTALFAPDLTGSVFAVGAELLVTAMLASPHFLYRSEMGRLASDGHYHLTPYETATALSYLFWGSMPDDNLMAAADADALASRAELRAQAERLLSDPRAVDQLATFATQWLRTDGVLGANKDADVYPGYTPQVRAAQMAEQARLFEDLFLNSDSPFEALFRADHTFVNGPLAAFYGLPDPGTGEALSRTALPPESDRGGILRLGAVLAAHAHQNESSPIKRGLFVRDRLLCQALPDPPANLDTTPPGLDPTLTTRERFFRHTADDACSSCHRYIDGVGFGFEGYDGVGARRTTENGLPIDESGKVLGLEGLSEPTVDEYVGLAALSDRLAKSRSAPRCLSLQYFRFAVGRMGLAADHCSIEQLAQAFEDGGLVLSDLLVEVTQLDAFLLKQDPMP